MPGARIVARRRLREIGRPAVPALVNALGHWSDETFDEAMDLLVDMGDVAAPAVADALLSDRLHVRYHARKVLARMGFPGDRAALRDTLVGALSAAHPLDRRSAADALGELRDPAAAPALRRLLDDTDWDVVAAAAGALGQIGDRSAVPAIEQTLRQASFVESRRDLAVALAGLGSPAGVPALLTGLDHPDDVLRRTFFDAKLLRYEGRNDDARAVLGDYLVRAPQDVFAHQELGNLASEEHDWTTADREYSTVVALIPTDGWALLFATEARQ